VPLIRAVMRQESGFKPCAVSAKGAQGLMQLMPETAQLLRVGDVFDPAQNVQAGASFLKRLLKKYNGDLRLALVAYNAGAMRADQSDPARYPLETQGYLANIFAELENWEDAGN
jgi:soluble lytic murein transglycosylase-like protein